MGLSKISNGVNMQVEEKELIYLYCVTKVKPNYRNLEDLGIKIYPIYFQGTYAIVSKVSPDEFNEENLKKNFADINWVENKVRQHEKVIEAIMQDATVIPFKFGTVFQTEENAEKLLREQSAEFKRIIANLNGKQEWGLKIYCDFKKFKDMLHKEDTKIKEIEKEIASASKGKAYFLRKKKDEFIKDIINEEVSKYTQDCFEKLKRISVDVKINKILSKEVTEKKEDMVLNAAFLINTKRIKEFNNAVEYLKSRYSDNGLIFNCTGPWPTYNFCSFGEKKE